MQTVKIILVLIPHTTISKLSVNLLNLSQSVDPQKTNLFQYDFFCFDIIDNQQLDFVL